MTDTRTGLRSVLTGIIAGAVILGAAGRLAMAGIALLVGAEVNLSPRSFVEVVILGAVVGGAGGLLFIPIGRWMGTGKIVSGVVLGAVLFIFSLMFSVWGWEWSAALVPVRAFTVFVAALIFFGFGIVLSAMMAGRSNARKV